MNAGRIAQNLATTEPRCATCYDGDCLCPGGFHPFGPCGYPRKCDECGREGA